MSKLASISANPLLTSYVQGAAEQSVSRVAEFIAPTVPVAQLVGHFKKWNDKTLLTIPDTRRALKGRAQQVGFDLSDEKYNCTPHALDFPVDKLEQDEAVIMDVVKEGANIVAQLASLAHEKTVLDLASADATAGATLDSTTSTVDLIDLIDAEIGNVIKGAKGMGAMMEIRILFGFSSLRKIKNHASVKDRFKVAGSKAPVNPSVQDLMNLFVTNVNSQVSLLVLDANKNLDAEAIDFMFGSKVLIFATFANPTRFDSSFMKTFRKMGAYMAPRIYQSEDGRVDVAGFDWSEEVQTTNAGASRICTVN